MRAAASSGWLRAAAAAASLAGAAQALAAAPGPAVDLALELALDPATRHLAAHAELSPATRDFRFALDETLSVTAASAAGRPLAVTEAGREGPLRLWRVSLPAAAARVRIDYGGTLPALDRELGERAVLGELRPMAGTKGSYLAAGSGWYPRPAPLFSYRVSVSVPGAQRAIVPGRLVSESLPPDAAGHYAARFEFAHPAEGIDLMAGPWIVRERRLPRAGGEPLRLRTYFDAELDAIPGLADGYLDDTAKYLARYAKAIGPYPFDGFSVVASPLPTGFGMPTLTYIGAAVLKLPFIRATSLGHEILHNWWGNGVYVDYAKGNWAEGLTTFMADYAYKEDESAEAARAMRLGWLRDFAAVPEEDRTPLVDFRSRTHGAAAAVGYGKAAMLFVMLRDEIGADAFARGIRRLWAEERFRVASWAELRAAFEAASGRSLATFFEEWLRRPGAPAVAIAAAEVHRRGAKASVALVVEQGAPAYALHLPVELVYPQRTELRWIDTAAPRETVQLAVGEVPRGVRLDPDLRVWRRLPPAELPPILRQWIVARAPRLLLASAAAPVREAAESLARQLCENAPQAVQAVEGGEPVLIAGLEADVDRALARAGLPPRPAELAGRGSAQVWTVPRAPGGGTPVAVISAQSAAALQALARPLPHYGGQSWLVFEGSRMAARGVWPASTPLVPVRPAP